MKINKIILTLFLAASLVGCSIYCESKGVGDDMREEFIKLLNEDMDRLYKLSGSKQYDKSDVCEQSKALRKYFHRDPILEANEALKSNNFLYLAVNSDHTKIPGEEIPDSKKMSLLKDKEFLIINGTTDHIFCGEQLYLMRYVTWYAAAYNTVLYKNETK